MLLYDLSFNQIQIHIESLLLNFTNFLEHEICRHCMSNHNEHGYGGLNHIIDKHSNLTELHVEKWLADIDHGFVHGFITCFWAFALGKFSNQYLKQSWSIFDLGHENRTSVQSLISEKDVLACFFHDLIKVMDTVVEGHDEKLRSIFYNLDEKTYRHANPMKGDEHYAVVAGDRLELMRYKNYREWCDLNIFTPYFQKLTKPLVNHFYIHVRPVIERIFKYSNEVWFLHHLEINEPPKRLDIYPPSYMCIPPTNLEKNYFSVDSGCLPMLNNCLDHKRVSKWHRKHFPLSGIINKSSIINCEAKIISAPDCSLGREHLFIKKKIDIPSQEWLFVYDTDDDLNIALEKKLFDPNNAHILKKEILNRVFQVGKKFIERCIALSS